MFSSVSITFFSQGNAALAALCPYLGQSELTAPVFAELLDISILPPLYRLMKELSVTTTGTPIFLEVLDVLFQVHNALFKRFQILIAAALSLGTPPLYFSARIVATSTAAVRL